VPDSWISPAIRDAEVVVRTAAIVVAGIWAYAKFVKGRVFQPRLETSVRASSQVRDNVITLAISFSAKNVGLSRVDITQDGSGLRVSISEPVTPDAMVAVPWTHKGTYAIFTRHGWIEPGESIFEEKLVSLPAGNASHILLELILESGNIVWTATSIVAANSQR
jgi:hypothetical protein